MVLPSDLLSQFAKATNDDPKPEKESIVYGVLVEINDKPYVRIDGSDLLTPATSTVNAQPGERVTIMIKNHNAIITGNITSPSARTDDVTSIESRLEDASRVATNFLEYDIDDRLQIGDKTSGEFEGFRIRLTDNSIYILDDAGNVLARIANELVELGKDSKNSVIRLCNAMGLIETQVDPDSGEEYLQFVSKKLRLKSEEISSLYSAYTDDTTRWEKSAAHVTPTHVHIYASECIDPSKRDTAEGWSGSDIHVDVNGITAKSPGDISIKSDGTLTVSDSHGNVYTVSAGSSGIWKYEKRSDGHVDLWGSYAVNDVDCITALGGMYRTALLEIDTFPFAIYEPNLVASYESDGYGGMLWATTTTTTTKPPSYYLIRPTSGTITNGKIIFQVHGRWIS